MIDVHRFLADDGAMPKPLPLLDPVPSADTCCSPLSDSPLSADEAVVVTGERRGVWTYYRVDPDALDAIAVLLTGARR
jgi:hypothetical protein